MSIHSIHGAKDRQKNNFNQAPLDKLVSLLGILAGTWMKAYFQVFGTPKTSVSMRSPTSSWVITSKTVYSGVTFWINLPSLLSSSSSKYYIQLCMGQGGVQGGWNPRWCSYDLPHFTFSCCILISSLALEWPSYQCIILSLPWQPSHTFSGVPQKAMLHGVGEIVINSYEQHGLSGQFLHLWYLGASCL